MEHSASLELTINARDQASGVLDNVRSNLDGIRAAVGGLGLAVAGGLAAAIQSTLHYDQLVGRLAKTTGMTAEQTSGLIAGFRGAGLSAEAAASTVQRLEMRLGAIAQQQAAAARSGKASNDVLTQLGISATDASGHVRSMNELMPILIDQLNKVADPAVRARLEMQLFGRNYAQLAPLLEAGGSAFTEATKKAARFGIVLSQDNIDAMHKFEGAKADLEMAFQGITTQLGNALIPMITRLVTAVTSVVAVFDTIPAGTRNVIIQILLAVAVFGTLLGGVAALQAGLALLAPILGPALVGALGGALGAVGAILGPLGVLVAIVLAAKFAYDHFGAAHRELQPLVTALAGPLNALAAGWRQFTAVMASGVDPIRAGVNGIQAFLDTLFRGAGLGQRFGAAFNGLARDVDRFLAALKGGGDVIGNVTNVIKDLMRPLDETGRLGQDLADVFGYIYDAGSALLDLVNELFSSMSNQGSLWGDLVAIGSTAWGGFVRVIDQVWQAIKPLFEDIKKNWPEIKAVITDIVDKGFKLLQGALEWIRDHHQEVRASVDLIVAGIATFIALQAGQVLPMIAKGWDLIGNSISGVAASVGKMDLASVLGGFGGGKVAGPPKEGKVLAGDLSAVERNTAAAHLTDIGAKGGVGVGKELEGLAVPIEKAAGSAGLLRGVLGGIAGIGRVVLLEWLPLIAIFMLVYELASHLSEVMKVITDITKGDWKKAWVDFKSLAGAIFKDMGGDAKALGPVLDAVGGFISKFVPPLAAAAGAVKEFVQILTETSSFTAALRDALIQLGVPADVVHRIFRAVGQAVEAIGRAGQTMMAALGPAWSQIQAALGPLMPQLQQLAVFVLPTLKAILTAVGVVIGVLAAVILAFMVGAFNGFVNAFRVVLPAAVEVVVGVIQVLTGVVQVFVGFFVGVVQVIDDLMHMRWKKAWVDAQQAVQIMWEGVQNIIIGLIRIVTGLLVGFFGGIIAFVKGFVEGFVGFFKWLYDALVGHSIVTDLVNEMIRLFVLLTTFVLNVIRVFVDVGIGVFNFFKDAFIGIARIVKDVVTGHFGDLKRDVLDLIGRLKDDALGVFDKLWAAIEGMAGRALDAAKSVGQGVVGGIVQGLEDSWWRISSALSYLARDLPQPIKDMFGITSPSSVFADEVGKPISLGIAKGITDNAVHIARALAGAVDVRPAALAGAMVGGSVGYGSLGGAAGGQVPVNVTTVIQIDRDVLARALNRVMGNQAKLQGMSYGSNA